MDKIAEKLSLWFGSAPFLLLHVVWFAVWLILRLDKELLTLIVSLEAIFLTILILRASNVSQQRSDRFQKQDIRATKRVEKKVDKVL